MSTFLTEFLSFFMDTSTLESLPEPFQYLLTLFLLALVFRLFQSVLCFVRGD